MKGQNIFFIIIAIAIITAAIVTMTYFIGVNNAQRNQDAVTVPDSASHSSQTYSTANSASSQENTKNSQSAASSSAASEINSHTETEPAAYVVKEFNGKICVFTESGDTPIQTLDIDVSTLPEGDQKVLQEGIKVESKEQLRRTLEDYES